MTYKKIIEAIQSTLGLTPDKAQPSKVVLDTMEIDCDILLSEEDLELIDPRDDDTTRRQTVRIPLEELRDLLAVCESPL